MNLAIGACLDIAIVLILILFLMLGIRKGFIRSVIRTVGKIAALILAVVFSEGLGNYINANYVSVPMREWLINQLSPTASNENAALSNLDLDALFRDLPQFFTDIAGYLGIDLTEMASQYETWKILGTEQAKSIAMSSMVEPISALISRLIAFVVIFVVCYLAVLLIWWLSDLIVNVPVIRQFDKLGGAILGVLGGVIVVFVLISVFNLAAPYLLPDMTLEEQQTMFNNTYLYSALSDVNPLNRIFGNWIQ